MKRFVNAICLALSILVACIATFGLSTAKLEKELIIEQYVDDGELLIPDGYFLVNGQETYLVGENTVSLSCNSITKVIIPSITISCPGHSFNGGEILEKGTTVGEFVCNTKTRINKTNNDKITLDLIGESNVIINVNTGFIIDKNSLELSLSMNETKIAINKTQIQRVSELSYQIKAWFDNDGDIFSGQRIQYFMLLRSHLLKGFLVPKKFVEEKNSFFYIKPITYYKKNECYYYALIEIVEEYLDYYIIEGNFLNDGMKICK